MKKYIISLVITFLAVATFVFAGNNPNGQPFQAIWDAINYLQEQIDNIEVMTGPAGPQGPQGEQGEQGLPGPQGEQGQNGKTFYLVDSNERNVGILLAAVTSHTGAGIEYHTYLQSEDVFLKFLEKRGNIEFMGVGNVIYFDEINCQGQASVLHNAISERQTTAMMSDGSIYRGNNTPGSLARMVKSRISNTQSCENFQPQSWSYMSYEVDKLQTAIWPLTLPLQVVEQ